MLDKIEMSLDDIIKHAKPGPQRKGIRTKQTGRKALGLNRGQQTGRIQKRRLRTTNQARFVRVSVK